MTYAWELQIPVADEQWLVDRLAKFASIFAIDVCGYALVENHCCLLMRVDRERALSWSAGEVVRRSTELFRAPPIVERWLRGEAGSAAREIAESMLELWRQRLCSISQYVASVNEHLARHANERNQARCPTRQAPADRMDARPERRDLERHVLDRMGGCARTPSRITRYVTQPTAGLPSRRSAQDLRRRGGRRPRAARRRSDDR